MQESPFYLCIEKMAAETKDFGSLIKRLETETLRDSFWLDYALSTKAKSQPVEKGLLARLWTDILATRQSGNNCFWLTHAYGTIARLAPDQIDGALIEAIAHETFRNTNGDVRHEARIVLGLIANTLSSLRYRHSHLHSLPRTHFSATYHSGLDLFDLPDGIKLMFDQEIDAPEKMVERWLKNLVKDPHVSCNGMSYGEDIIPALIMLLGKAVDRNRAAPAEFKESARLLTAIGSMIDSYKVTVQARQVRRSSTPEPL
jgi:hypothetical protein